MRLTFPTTTIASVSGAALLATLAFNKNDQVAASVNFAYDEGLHGSVRAASKTKGRECSYSDTASKHQNIHADTGVLACGVEEICVQDATSTFGGRCAVLEEQGVVVHAHRNLATSCFFSNGTAGTKCDGNTACSNGTNMAQVSCGSCIGDYACAGNLTIMLQ